MYAQSELSATEGRYDTYHHAVRCLERLWVLCQLLPSATDLLNQSSFTDIKPTDKLGTLSGACLLEVTPSASSARASLYSILQEVVQSTDILAHFEAFSWLISHGLTDTPVVLNSPHLEAYLRSQLRQCPDDPDLRCLLWRQLERRGARLESSQILEHLAVTPCLKLTLEARLDFAARKRLWPDFGGLHSEQSELKQGFLHWCNHV
ncbi:Nuclear pore complex protein Nup154 [Clonorchis sinensis]|uniref:Nuclear pore complex protein Nup154 n=1 Tax=Clonorchis sinensis TaxID=79923 RepID=A0A8T1MU66_CLOSI|nr:Nuclear pore complex protein Nup154 [Clonorchis sinensis]